MKLIKYFVLATALVAGAASCSSEEIGEKKDVVHPYAHPEDRGTLTVNNVSSDSFLVTIFDDKEMSIRQFYQGGNNSLKFEVEGDKNYSVEIFQKTGYLLFPTKDKFKSYVAKKRESQVNYPQ